MTGPQPPPPGDGWDVQTGEGLSAGQGANGHGVFDSLYAVESMDQVNGMSAADALVWYNRHGIPAYPAHPTEKKLAGPGGYHFDDLGVLTEEQLGPVWQTMQQHPELRAAIVLGKASGLLAIDVDDLAEWEQFRADHPDALPATAEQVTGREGGGLHLLLRRGDADEALLRQGSWSAAYPHIEVKTRGLIIAAPSLHASGARYQWRPGPMPADIGEVLTERRPPVVIGKHGLMAADAARWVMGQGPLRYGIDNQLWAYRSGVWVPGEDPADDTVHQRITELLGNQFRQAHGSNIREVIRAQAATISCAPLPEVINFRDGLLYWQTEEEVRRHSPDVPSTVQLASRWDPGAKCPEFDKFLAAVMMPGDVGRMWEAIGYLLMSGNPLHKIVLLLGRGFNGKGALMRMLIHLLGPRSVSSVSLHALADERFTRARLVGKLANICGDIDATYIERTGLLKQLTGEDQITADRKFREPAEFTCWAVPVFAANEIPTSSDTSLGWLNRWEVFRFPNVFPADPAFEAPLHTEAELAGIAANGVRALRALMSRTPPGLARTDAGDAAREEFRTYQDPIAGWLGECCWAAAGAWTDRRHAHASYTWWRKESGGKNPLGKQKFYALMRERFPVAVRNGWEGYDGLALRPQ